jgi:hypothetical protein
MPSRSSTARRKRPTLKSLQARITRLELLCAEVYQVAGQAGAPVRVLDALAAAMNGKSIPRKSLLPIVPSEFDPIDPLGAGRG